jgi:hypothetical protein
MGIDSLVSTVKKLMDVAKKVNNAEVEILIADLKLQFAELQDENTQLRKKLSDKTEVKEIKKKLELTNDGLFLLKENYEGYHAGLYCTLCINAHDKFILVKEGDFLGGKYNCPNCKEFYGKKDEKSYVTPEQPQECKLWFDD